MKRKLMMIACLCTLLMGCASKPVQQDMGESGEQQDVKTPVAENTVQTDIPEKDNSPKGYMFKSGDAVISVDQDMSEILAALGEPDSYFEAPSCAFEGKDKIYTYSHFVIYTYPQGDKDFVSSVVLMDDFVETPEGVYIGSALSDILKAYGTEYKEEKGSCTYSKDGMNLLFLYDEDEYVTSIQYISGILDAAN